MRIEETKFGETFKNECISIGFETDPSDAHLLLNIYVIAFVDYLASVKEKAKKKVSIRVNDSTGAFIIGFACEYHEPDEVSEVDTGNWTLICSFEEDDIKYVDETNSKPAKIYDANDEAIVVSVINTALKKYHVQIHQKDYVTMLCVALFKSLEKYLNENAKANMEEVIDIENVGIIKFYATVDADNKPVKVEKSFDLDGSLKRMIKDDAVLALK